jgi:hypothetical protein
MPGFDIRKTTYVVGEQVKVVSKEYIEKYFTKKLKRVNINTHWSNFPAYETATTKYFTPKDELFTLEHKKYCGKTLVVKEVIGNGKYKMHKLPASLVWTDSMIDKPVSLLDELEELMKKEIQNQK